MLQFFNNCKPIEKIMAPGNRKIIIEFSRKLISGWCTPCEGKWSKHTIGGKTECLIYAGNKQALLAETTCGSLGARLPVPKSMDENLELSSAVNSIRINVTSVALGITDNVINGIFADSVCEFIKFDWWGAGEPSQLTYQHDYVKMKVQGNDKYSWTDLSGNSHVDIVCMMNTVKSFCPPTTGKKLFALHKRNK